MSTESDGSPSSTDSVSARTLGGRRRQISHRPRGNGHLAASIQNQALSALEFLYEHVLEQPLDRIEGVAFVQKVITHAARKTGLEARSGLSS